MSVQKGIAVSVVLFIFIREVNSNSASLTGTLVDLICKNALVLKRTHTIVCIHRKAVYLCSHHFNNLMLIS